MYEYKRIIRRQAIYNKGKVVGCGFTNEFKMLKKYIIYDKNDNEVEVEVEITIHFSKTDLGKIWVESEIFKIITEIPDYLKSEVERAFELDAEKHNEYLNYLGKLED